jgi:hypothetical protein
MGVQSLRTSGIVNNQRQKNISAVFPLTVEHLVVAGGGGGATDLDVGGAGGAGGLISGTMSLTAGQTYSATIGAGGVRGTGPDGTGVGGGSNGGNGANTVFATLTAIGGGGGGTRQSNGAAGGSGGGGGDNGRAGGAGTPGQGFAGANSPGMNGNGGFDSGAGGGAGGPGSLNVAGPGLVSTITGVTYARGGIGSQGGSLTAGADNTGNGGDGCRPGGSGIIALKYPIFYNITIGAGLTGSTTTVGTNKVTIITAGTGNVSFN